MAVVAVTKYWKDIGLMMTLFQSVVVKRKVSV